MTLMAQALWEATCSCEQTLAHQCGCQPPEDARSMLYERAGRVLYGREAAIT